MRNRNQFTVQVEGTSTSISGPNMEPQVTAIGGGRSRRLVRGKATRGVVGRAGGRWGAVDMRHSPTKEAGERNIHIR